MLDTLTYWITNLPHRAHCIVTAIIGFVLFIVCIAVLCRVFREKPLTYKDNGHLYLRVKR
jgi:hypothetical protein